MIRSATAADLALLPAIEAAAGAPFRDIGMDAVADDAPPTVAALAVYQRGGRAWVATDGADVPVGYALAVELPGSVHLEQISIDPAVARQGLGAALIDEVARWASARGHRWLTLTTFARVPWNAPYYRRIGFEQIPDAEMTPDLEEIRAREAGHGLAAWPRVTMRRNTF